MSGANCGLPSNNRLVACYRGVTNGVTADYTARSRGLQMGQLPPVITRNYVSVTWYNVTKVARMGWGGGDSGGAVFAGNGSPYYALGLQVAGTGANDGTVCTAGTGCSACFTRWSNIEQDLGFALNPITGQ